MPLAPLLDELLADSSLPPARSTADETLLSRPLVCLRSPCHLVILPTDDHLEMVLEERYQPVPPTVAVVAPQGSLVALRPSVGTVARLRWMAITETPLDGGVRQVPLQGNHLLHLWDYLASATTLDEGLQTLVRSLLLTGVHQRPPSLPE